VADRVAGVLAHVEHQPVAALEDALGLGHRTGHREQLGQDLAVILAEVGRGADVVPRDHKDVRRRDRLNVTKGVREGRAGHLGGGHLSGNDAAEQALRHRRNPIAGKRRRRTGRHAIAGKRRRRTGRHAIAGKRRRRTGHHAIAGKRRHRRNPIAGKRRRRTGRHATPIRLRLVPENPDQLDRLLQELGRWSALERAEETAAGRMREGWLRRQAAEEATWASLAADLAERHAHVIVHVAGDRVHRGRLLASGLDFLLLVTGEGSTRPLPVLLALAGVTAVRQATSEVPPGPAERRQGDELPTLASLLARLSAERPWVRVVLTGGETVVGDLDSVGEDVAIIRLADGQRGLAYLRLAAVAEVSLLGSG
jgi:hypothetical protein